MTIPGVLCSGSIVSDTLVRPVDGLTWGTTHFLESIENHVGGNGANTSRALGILGIDVRLMGVVGWDDRAEWILPELQRSGVDTSAVVRIERPTAATIVLVNEAGERMFLHRLGASEEAFRKPVEFTPALCDGVSHYHFASLYVLPWLRVNGAEMLRRARVAGLTTSLDTNWDPQGEWMKALEPCLPHVDILFLNEDEARMLTGSAGAAETARIVLAKGGGTAVLKLGGRGCAIFTSGEEIRCPAFDVTVKDTTGAGDSFAAGFLAARQRGASWAEAGCFANAVGALSVQELGAVTGVRPLAETEAWMKSARVRAWDEAHV